MARLISRRRSRISAPDSFVEFGRETLATNCNIQTVTLKYTDCYGVTAREEVGDRKRKVVNERGTNNHGMELFADLLYTQRSDRSGISRQSYRLPAIEYNACVVSLIIFLRTLSPSRSGGR